MYARKPQFPCSNSGPDSAFSYHISNWRKNLAFNFFFSQCQNLWNVTLLHTSALCTTARICLAVPFSLSLAKRSIFSADFQEQLLILSIFYSEDWFLFFPLLLFFFFINMSTLLLNIKGFSGNQFYHICLGVIWMFRIEIKSTKIDFLDLWDIPVFNSPSVCADTMQSRNEASGSPTFHLWTLAPDVNHS